MCWTSLFYHKKKHFMISSRYPYCRNNAFYIYPKPRMFRDVERLIRRSTWGGPDPNPHVPEIFRDCSGNVPGNASVPNPSSGTGLFSGPLLRVAGGREEGISHDFERRRRRRRRMTFGDARRGIHLFMAGGRGMERVHRSLRSPHRRPSPPPPP